MACTSLYIFLFILESLVTLSPTSRGVYVCASVHMCAQVCMRVCMSSGLEAWVFDSRDEVKFHLRKPRAETFHSGHQQAFCG